MTRRVAPERVHDGVRDADELDGDSAGVYARSHCMWSLVFMSAGQIISAGSDGAQSPKRRRPPEGGRRRLMHDQALHERIVEKANRLGGQRLGQLPTSVPTSVPRYLAPAKNCW